MPDDELENAYLTFNFDTLVDCVIVKDRCGYVKDVETALEIIAQYEKATTSKFVVRRYSHSSAKSFGTADATERSHFVLWQNAHIPFSGVPLMILGSKCLSCQHGPDININKKKAYAEKVKNNPFIKHRVLKRKTKKLNCPAEVILYDAVVFPDHKIDVDTKKRRTVKSAALRRELGEGVAKQERRVYICLPSMQDHVGHIVEKVFVMEQAKVITEFPTKAELSGTQMENFHQKWLSAEEECRTLKAKLDALQKRLQACEKQNEEFRLILTKRGESVHPDAIEPEKSET